MPKLVNIVRSSYDPVSTSQANKLVGCFFRLVSDFPTLTPRSKQLRELLSVVLDMVKECLFSILPKTVLVSFQALQECHSMGGNVKNKSCICILNLVFQGVISDGIIAELVLDRLLNRYMLLSLRANMDMLDSIDKARQVLLKEED